MEDLNSQNPFLRQSIQEGLLELTPLGVFPQYPCHIFPASILPLGFFAEPLTNLAKKMANLMISVASKEQRDKEWYLLDHARAFLRRKKDDLKPIS